MNRVEGIAREIEKIDNILSKAAGGLKVISLRRWKQYKERRNELVVSLVRKDKK